MTRVNIINCVVLIFVQFCILAITTAYHETVNIKIKNGDEIIELNWKRTKPYMANKNLPIWGNWPYKLNFMQNLMNTVGDFVTYHDLEKSSAVAYFANLDAFNGVIDTRFVIIKLPLKYIGQVPYFEVGGPYVSARENPQSEQHSHNDQNNLLLKSLSENEINYVNSLIDSMIAPSVPSTSTSSEIDKYQPNNIPSTTTGHACRPKSTVLHPEILVFITYDIIFNFIKFHPTEGVVLAVIYYITYFNAINMLFAKLATNDIEIHINIAGLVLEFEPGAFPYKFSKHELPIFQNTPHLDAYETIDHFSNYIKKNKLTFNKDSFDFFFILTNYPIEKNGMTTNGISTLPFDVYEERKKGAPYKNFLGLAIQQKDAFGDYIIATRQIAVLMNIEYDFPNEKSSFDNKQFYGIMQPHDNYCHNCLVWSEKSQQELKQYARFNKNRCFLLNYPRSLYPYNSKIRSMNPEDQCSCFGFDIRYLDPMYMISIPSDSCSAPLKCSRQNIGRINGILPLDGTPCGDINKVCWNAKCFTIKEEVNVNDCKESCPPKRQKITHEDVQQAKLY